MKSKLRFLVSLVLVALITDAANSQDKSDASAKSLQLFNTRVFGKSTSDPIVLLQPKVPGSLIPETILVDVRDDKYFAATVTYPNEVSLAEARQFLNLRYGKWEKASFSNDPTMGLWRNEDDHFAIQLTEDEDYLQLIYIDFSMMTSELWGKALSEAAREMCEVSEQSTE